MLYVYCTTFDMYNMYDMCNCFTAKVSVSNFKVEKSENLENAFYVFLRFLTWHFKNVKRRVFLDFENVKKRIIELWVTLGDPIW